MQWLIKGRERRRETGRAMRGQAVEEEEPGLPSEYSILIFPKTLKEKRYAYETNKYLLGP